MSMNLLHAIDPVAAHSSAAAEQLHGKKVDLCLPRLDYNFIACELSVNEWIVASHPFFCVICYELKVVGMAAVYEFVIHLRNYAPYMYVK